MVDKICEVYSLNVPTAMHAFSVMACASSSFAQGVHSQRVTETLLDPNQKMTHSNFLLE